MDKFSESITYVGSSMNPIFRDGDALRLEPCNGKVRRGDVIVFTPPEGDRKIIHRVISVGPEGARTRGDNNGSVDPWDLKPREIIGRVVSLRRNGREIAIPGGEMGRLQELAIRMLRRVDVSLTNLFRGSYHRLARSSFARRFLHGCFTTRVITVNRPEGKELQLLVGERLAGRLLPGKKAWTIWRPYLLFVDEETLPMGSGNLSDGKESRERASGYL
ncbi:MAG: S24/S26 family peptidase [Deltaproteobacteria bacterium]|nr:S24/S26 family peptidase [Deltaproteobacteria bacterium]